MAGEARPSVALLGTGIMGAAMARSMLRAGLPLHVWNRTEARAEELDADGAVVAATPAEAVRRADVIVTMLPDTSAVKEVMTAAAPGLRPGQVWAQASTVGVAGCGELAGLAAERDLVYVDSPVLGTRQPAEQGSLIVLAAGPERARDRVQPVFDAIGARTMWVGAAGAASRLKLVVNNWVLALTTAVAETLALARGLEIDPEKFLEAVSGGQLDCGYLRTKAAVILQADLAPSFSVDLAGKDAKLIVAASEATGVRMDMAEAVARRFRRAAGLGYAGQDMAATYYASFGDD